MSDILEKQAGNQIFIHVFVMYSKIHNNLIHSLL